MKVYIKIILISMLSNRSIKAWSISANNIIFSAICKHPAIEASIRKFCDYIDDELKNCNVILSKNAIALQYHLELPTQINRSKITAEKDIATGEPKYIYHNTSFHLSKNQVIDLLMGTKLYGNPEVALRELLQNSIDACLLSKSLHEKWEIPYKPLITVKYYTIDNEDYLEVTDNGIGMNQEIVDKYYSKIGASYYKSRDFFDLQASNHLTFKPISRFGIGILSSFMVADTIEVETKRLKDKYEYDSPLKILIEGYDSIFTTVKSERKEPGTSTKLYLRKSKNPWSKLSNEGFISIVKNAVSKPDIDIEIITDKESITYTDTDFYSYHANNLKGYSWNVDENIKQIGINFNENGFQGNAIVAIIEKSNHPVKTIDRLSKNVDIDGEDYELSMEIKYGGDNSIKKGVSSISITDDGEINPNFYENIVAESKARFSIHGITFSGEIFPNWYSRDKKCMFKWPFPILLVLNLGGDNDLDLNSARNEIIYNEKWDSFEQELSFIILKKIKEKLSSSYWSELVVILRESKSENFIIGLNRIK